MKPKKMKSRIEKNRILTFFFFLCACALLSAASPGSQSNELGKCSTLGLNELTSKEIRSRLRHTEPIDPPCCSGTLDLKGTVILDISVSADGDISCVEQISGHPLILTSVIHSVSGWRFKPYSTQGQRVPFHGKLAIKFHATERAVSYKVVEAPQSRRAAILTTLDKPVAYTHDAVSPWFTSKERDSEWTVSAKQRNPSAQLGIHDCKTPAKLQVEA